MYKLTIRPCMEYCCHVWASAPSCYLELLDKLKNGNACTVGLLIASSLEPLGHRRNVISLSLDYVYEYYLVDVHLERLNWLHFILLEGGLLVILINCMVFLSSSLDVSRMSLSKVSFFALLNSRILCL